MIAVLRVLLFFSLLTAPLSAFAGEEACPKKAAAVDGGGKNVRGQTRQEGEPGDGLPGWQRPDFTVGANDDNDEDLIPLAPLVPEREEEEPAPAEEADSYDDGLDVVETEPFLDLPLSEPGKEDRRSDTPAPLAIHKSWWFWTALAVGAAVAGGTAYASRRQEPELIVPSRSLGYVNWR